jgi:hypothetical protein
MKNQEAHKVLDDIIYINYLYNQSRAIEEPDHRDIATIAAKSDIQTMEKKLFKDYEEFTAIVFPFGTIHFKGNVYKTILNYFDKTCQKKELSEQAQYELYKDIFQHYIEC